jgi:hypothetical protein
VVDVIGCIYENPDKAENVVGIYLHFEKAFNTVDHDILSHELYNYRMQGITHDRFKNYSTK